MSIYCGGGGVTSPALNTNRRRSAVWIGLRLLTDRPSLNSIGTHSVSQLGTTHVWEQADTHVHTLTFNLKRVFRQQQKQPHTVTKRLTYTHESKVLLTPSLFVILYQRHTSYSSSPNVFFFRIYLSSHNLRPGESIANNVWDNSCDFGTYFKHNLLKIHEFLKFYRGLT